MGKKLRYPVSPVPLWYRLSIHDRQALYDYQMNTYGLELSEPYYHDPLFSYSAKTPTLTEIDKEMRERPHHPAHIH